MEKYYVYLDESGDFDTDLTPGSWRNPSLVGGFFWRHSAMPSAHPLIRSIESFLGGNNHATELAADKGTFVHRFLRSAKTFPIEFVIFQNDERQKIISSTQTYLTVVTEGLVQLLKSLVILEQGPVELEVVAGFKKDTTQPVTASYVEGYIPLTQYQNRLAEKLSIEKAKLKNTFVQNSEIHISLADDKRNSCLVLCDYICNFWYTQTAAVFHGNVMQDGVSVPLRTAIASLYRSEYHFSLFGTEEQNHVLNMLRDGVFADALFESCAGMLTPENRNLVEQSFLSLPGKQIHRQLGNLADYNGDLMLFWKDAELLQRVLDGADALYRTLTENKKPDLKFYLDMQLYRLAYLSNFCHGEHMEEIFTAIEGDVARYTAQTLDMDYLLIFCVRRAVYLCDTHRYHECCAVCDSMDALLQIIAEALQSNDCVALQDSVCSEQLGKVLGTRLQAQIALCALGQESPEKGRETSNRALAQFTYPLDLNRQYQYRSELESVAGAPHDALHWLERSFGGTGWKKRITSKEHSVFDIYNLLFLAAFTQEQEPALSKEIAVQVYKSCLKEIEQSPLVSEECRLLLGIALLADPAWQPKGASLLSTIAHSGGRLSAAAQAAAEGFGPAVLFEAF